MKLCLQYGYGMKAMAEHLTAALPGTDVVLSPRDIPQAAAIALSAKLQKNGGSVFLDPQLYALTSGKELKYVPKYDFWPGEHERDQVDWRAEVCRLFDVNERLNAAAVILPAPYTKKIDGEYLAVQDQVVSAVKGARRPVYMTLCLAPRVMSSEKDVAYLLAKADEWPVDGYYVIPERPDGDYLTDDPLWMANLLRLCAGLKLKGKYVMVGYASHQQLSLACAGVDALASGHYMNVRSFTMDKFLTHAKTDYAKRKVWYYCPQSLSEFSLQYLDIAYARKQLPVMKPSVGQCRGYVEMLFSGALPSSTGFNEPQAFRNYLVALSAQCAEVSAGKTFSRRYADVKALYGSAAELLGFLHKYEIRGQSRDFEDFVDVSMSALDLFKEEHGFLLEHMPQCYSSAVKS